MVKEVFKRNKTPLEKKVLASMLCFAGLSYRKVSSLVGGMSRMAVQRAFIAMKGLPKPERKPRRLIAIDETKAKLNGMFAYGRDTRSLGLASPA